jgi:hypothetical protein
MSDSAQDDASSGSTEATAGTAGASQAAEAAETDAPLEADPVPEDGDGPDLADVKRHFREALDRKNKANSRDLSAADGKAKDKAQVAHGPASTRRSFRRKSG